MNARSETQVVAVSFDDNGAWFDFIDSDAIRKEGALVMQRRLFVGAHSDYVDGIADLMDKAQEVLADALEDYPQAPLFEVADEGDGEGELGMGWAADGDTKLPHREMRVSEDVEEVDVGV